MTANTSNNELFDFLKRHEDDLPLRNVEEGKKVAALVELKHSSRVDCGPILALKEDADTNACELSVSQALPSAARSFSASALPDLLVHHDQMQVDDEREGSLVSICFGLTGLALETTVNRPMSPDHLVDAVALRLPMLTGGIVHACRDGRGELVLRATVAMPSGAFPEANLLKACKALCASVTVVRRIHDFVWQMANPQATATHNALLDLAGAVREEACNRQQRRERKSNGQQTKTETVSL